MSSPLDEGRPQRIDETSRRTGKSPRTMRPPRSPLPSREGHAVAHASKPTTSETDDVKPPGEGGEQRQSAAEKHEGSAPHLLEQPAAD